MSRPEGQINGSPLADTRGLCDQIQANIAKANSQLVILLGEAGAGTASAITAAGTFPISSDLSLPRVAVGVSTYTDPQCVLSDLSAVSGSITLTNLGQNAASATGSLRVVFGVGASLTGGFSVANSCPTIAVDTYLNRNPTCG